MNPDHEAIGPAFLGINRRAFTDAEWAQFREEHRIPPPDTTSPYLAVQQEPAAPKRRVVMPRIS